MGKLRYVLRTTNEIAVPLAKEGRKPQRPRQGRKEEQENPNNITAASLWREGRSAKRKTQRHPDRGYLAANC